MTNFFSINFVKVVISISVNEIFDFANLISTSRNGLQLHEIDFDLMKLTLISTSQI